ncbi:PREDICTED: protein phosphatase PHLPP-like protein isoform X1 [Bactrocera latifrons]|uniref:Protein phosphatase PHLPP-like protein n=2 Tax=Bactrocera latifrons TaxID=174628 RepID=A0A0K8WI19_BACLA|nr:PREDICTED: protein phosphatase PHLPP-like protein isoform X1 [Bactrocera latifrons]
MIKSGKQKACIEMTGSKLKIRTNTLEQSHVKESNSNERKLGYDETQLGGNILIGNYDFLKELEITDNGMGILDLSSLAQLETLTCNHNKLKELIMNGKSLKTVKARHNNLATIKMLSAPTHLVNIDISYNDFEELPDWLGACYNLESLYAEHNRLWTIDNIFATDGFRKLHTFSLAYNQLTTLNVSTLIFGAVANLYLQCNKLQKLPDNFFAITHKTLRLLNVSCNNLCAVGDNQNIKDNCCLQELYLSNNNLNENIFSTFVGARQLRIMHAAYNNIRELPENIIRNWTDLEVLVLSGNKLQNLPENICVLTKLEVLRLHSNLLHTTPSLTKLANLKVLDLAHNHLDHVNLLSIMPKNIKYLDLSCNLQLQFDERQVQMCQSLKKMSLVDVSGKNRACLPTNKLAEMKDSNVLRQPWMAGFTETIGKCRKLLVKQIRLCNFAEDEGFFGMLESATLGALNTTFVNLVPQILLHERSVKETAKEYMKYTLLSVYQRLASERGCEDLHIALCHIAKESAGFKDYMRPKRSKRFILRVASIGNIEAHLVRKTSTICLTSDSYNATLSHADNFKDSEKALITDPTIHETFLSNDDEFLVICNANIWRVMNIERVTQEIRREENIVLAAKRLQDIAQSFGADENLSVIIVRFRYIGTDVDDLLKELKQTVRKNPITQNMNCDDKHSIGSQRLIGRCSPRQVLMGAMLKSDRSSPSGQSDQVQNFLNKGVHGEEYAFATEHVLEEDDDELEILHETDSVLSEEQFKCWEYMLEQNTQLLFDKELNTISKSITKDHNSELPAELNISLDKSEYKESNLIKTFGNRFISHSSPQLLYSEIKKPLTTFTHKHQEKRQQQRQQQQQQQKHQQQVSFLSKHFGSCRSFQTQSRYNLFESKSQNSVNVGLNSKWSGGPNAAYFGSLQRLMPYNLEYDFTVTQDRTAFNEEDDEYDEQEDRMKKYWGIATTEL